VLYSRPGIKTFVWPSFLRSVAWQGKDLGDKFASSSSRAGPSGFFLNLSGPVPSFIGQPRSLNTRRCILDLLVGGREVLGWQAIEMLLPPENVAPLGTQ
jgi:hypothetical protein